MATQPPYNWRVPLDTDRPGGARQMRELATDVAATVAALNSTIQVFNGSTISGRAAGWSKIALDTAVPGHAAARYTFTGGEVTVLKAGVYLLTWTVTANGATIHRLVSSARINGVETTAMNGGQVSGTFTTTVGLSGSRAALLAAGDKVALWAFHDPAGQAITAQGAHLEITALHN
jgi:hypothetical protein